MRRAHTILAATFAALLAACLIAAYITRDGGNATATKPPAAVNSGPSNSGAPLDGRLFQTAQQMQALADTSEEQAVAGDAVRLADHELDQAFASALREAAAASLPASGPLKQLTDRIAGWKAKVAVDELLVATLTTESTLELAKAQLALDQDELEDAQQDLSRQGGDPRTRLQRALQEHEAARQQPAPQSKPATTARTSTLWEQTSNWLALMDRQRQLEAARKQAGSHAAALDREHNALEALSTNQAANQDGTGQEDTATLVSRLRRLSDRRKAIADLDKRMQDSEHLADVYAKWSAAVAVRRSGVLHLLLNSMAVVLAILLAAILIDSFIRRAFLRQADPRRLHQLRVIITVVIQVATAVFIVLVVAGPPTQISTVIGLVTAGLTVALKDFIVAFFGWFALMGRNGIRIGDWVEIHGVGGEVVEIGLWKTVLLESGESGSTGHPTGRRVSFVNNFAIEGHYFNFSTAGQWLWDELQVTLPATGDPYQLTQQIREIVERETGADQQQAEKDWERVTRQYGTRPFSAKPIADLRPAGSGLSVMVRYITRAPQRQQAKTRLFTAIVELLHTSATAQ